MKRSWLVVVSMVLLAGCGSEPPIAVDPVPDECGVVAEPRTKVTFANDRGDTLNGVILGDGKIGVVLAHQNNGSLCQWEEYAVTLAGKGYRALAFDFAGNGASTGSDRTDQYRDVMAAATFLRGQGADGIVLIGASRGGAAVVAAAGQLTPAPVAVANLSGTDGSGDVVLKSIVGSLTMPVLYLVAKLDEPYAGTARTLAPLTTSAGTDHVELTSTSTHGVDLLLDPQAVAALEGFLAKHAQLG